MITDTLYPATSRAATTAAVSSENSPRCCQLVNRSTSPLGRLPIPSAETAYPSANASPYRAPAPQGDPRYLLVPGFHRPLLTR
jgi:hypothetical protein